jgi:hypothetical protein
LHPERAENYNYCTARECQEKNARGLTIVAVGVNKSAEQYQILDDRTREDIANGKYHDQRRASFGRSPLCVETATPPGDEAAPSGRRRGPARRAVPIRAARSAWTGKQENLARIYHEQGIRPEEIARRLGLSQYQVTQLLLAVTSRRGR